MLRMTGMRAMTSATNSRPCGRVVLGRPADKGNGERAMRVAVTASTKLKNPSRCCVIEENVVGLKIIRKKDQELPKQTNRRADDPSDHSDRNDDKESGQEVSF